MPTVTFQRGQWVKHLKRPEWGMGEVLDQDGDTVRVVFEHEGEKKLDTRYVSLETAERPPDSHSVCDGLTVRPNVDIEKLTAACLLFHDEMKDNRANSDDGGMALQVLEDMKRKGHLTRSSARRLFAWCHTDGSVFQRGVDLARQICTLIFGRVPRSLSEYSIVND